VRETEKRGRRRLGKKLRREREKVWRKGEKRGRRRLGRLPKTCSTGSETGSTGPETGSTGFAAAHTVNAQKKRTDCVYY
jgi:hypothetical protein